MEFKKVINNKNGDYHHKDEKGKWQSERVRFRINGNILYKTYYKDHKEHGVCTWYKETGEIDCKSYYWNDEKISKKEYFQNILKLI